jgi:hypothetical protein
MDDYRLDLDLVIEAALDLAGRRERPRGEVFRGDGGQMWLRDLRQFYMEQRDCQQYDNIRHDRTFPCRHQCRRSVSHRWFRESYRGAACNKGGWNIGGFRPSGTISEVDMVGSLSVRWDGGGDE